jgi:uncharacterized protein YndB with AHSA1/START domain
MTTDPVTATIHIDAPPEKVWEYFTQPGALVRWMGEYALAEAQPGGRFAVDIQGVPVRGRFLSLDAPRRLLIGWGHAGSDQLPPGTSTVEVRLTPDGSGTRVDLEHRDLPPALQPGHAAGWAHYLARLAAAAAGESVPGPVPATCPHAPSGR